MGLSRDRAGPLRLITCSLARTAPTAHGFQVGQTAWSPTRNSGQGNLEKGRTMFRTSLEGSQNRSQSMILRVLRYPIVWLELVALLATPMLILGTRAAVQATTFTPADLFMQSVVKLDGTLGWHQLCPALQAQLPLSELASQVTEQRIAESGQDLTLTVDYVGAHARPQGGQIRMYVVTAHRPDGLVGQKTYIVYTQVSGCVEDVKNF